LRVKGVESEGLGGVLELEVSWEKRKFSDFTCRFYSLFIICLWLESFRGKKNSNLEKV